MAGDGGHEKAKDRAARVAEVGLLAAFVLIVVVAVMRAWSWGAAPAAQPETVTPVAASTATTVPAPTPAPVVRIAVQGNLPLVGECGQPGHAEARLHTLFDALNRGDVAAVAALFPDDRPWNLIIGGGIVTEETLRVTAKADMGPLVAAFAGVELGFAGPIAGRVRAEGPGNGVMDGFDRLVFNVDALLWAADGVGGARDGGGKAGIYCEPGLFKFVLLGPPDPLARK